MSAPLPKGWRPSYENPGSVPERSKTQLLQLLMKATSICFLYFINRRIIDIFIFSFFEGFSPQPTALSTRLIVASWWLFCLVILASYIGNLVAFLAVERQKIPFTNLHELLQQEEYLFGVLSNSILTLLFEVCYFQILFQPYSK